MNQKGTFCLFSDESLFCQEGDCKNCHIFIHAIETASGNLCPLCGADVDVWQEVFGEEHKCH